MLPPYEEILKMSAQAQKSTAAWVSVIQEVMTSDLPDEKKILFAGMQNLTVQLNVIILELHVLIEAQNVIITNQNEIIANQNPF